MVDKTVYTPHGFELTGVPFKVHCTGVQPHLECQPARHLPIVASDNHAETGITIGAGTVLAIDIGTEWDAGEYKRLVPCNGLTGTFLEQDAVYGAATATEVNDNATALDRRLKYTSSDVGEVLDPTTITDVLASIDANANPGTGAKYLVPNYPIGIAAYNIYNGATEEIRHNFKIQQNTEPLCSGVIEMPVTCLNELNSVQAASVALLVTDVDGSGGTIGTYAGQSLVVAADALAHTLTSDWTEWKPGRFLMPDHLGRLIIWNTWDDPQLIVGRILTVEPIADTSGLAYVKTAPGLYLAGSGTSGTPQHLYHNYGGTVGGLCLKKARIQLMMK